VRAASAAPRRPAARMALAVVAVGLWVALAADGRNHWHEWRYLYSAVRYPLASLVGGDFDPGPSPERSRAEVGAWYWGQIGHEAILAAAARRTGLGPTGIRRIQALYASFVVVALGLAWLALRSLPLAVDPLRIVLVALLSPLGAWIGFKLMPEGPALALAAASMTAFSASLRAGTGASRVGLALASGAALGVSALVMISLPLAVLGFGVAAGAVFSRDFGLARLAASTALALAAFLVAWIAGAATFGIAPGDYLTMYRFYRGYAKSPLVALFGIATAFSLLWLLVPAAAWTRRRRELAFFALWAASALLPLLLLSSNYLEARFLVVALLPLAGLLVLGLEALAGERAAAVWAAILVGVPLVTLATLPLLPFEMSSRELDRVTERILARDPDAVLLLPWNYTDYHFLALARPETTVLLVQSPVDAEGRAVRDEAWLARRRATYGSTFVASPEELARYRSRPLYYVGHGRMPPFRNLARLANLVGLDFVARRIDAMNPLEHLTHSWMWEDPAFVFTEMEPGGHYRVFRVRFAPEEEMQGRAGGGGANLGPTRDASPARNLADGCPGRELAGLEGIPQWREKRSLRC